MLTFGQRVTLCFETMGEIYGPTDFAAYMASYCLHRFNETDYS